MTEQECPFRPMTNLCGWTRRDKAHVWEDCPVCSRVLAHNDGAVPKLARVIYDERRFDLLPILADALEEAGCVGTDPCPHCGGKGYHDTGMVRFRCLACGDGRLPHPLVAHLRSPGPHARGCYAVDLILGDK